MEISEVLNLYIEALRATPIVPMIPYIPGSPGGRFSEKHVHSPIQDAKGKGWAHIVYKSQ